MESLQYKFQTGCIQTPEHLKGQDISRKGNPPFKKCIHNRQGDLTVPALLCAVFSLFVHVCVCVSWSAFVASLLIKHKGPAALLCWVRYCRGLIWLHSGPLSSKAAELYLQIRQRLAEPLCRLAFLSERESRFGPCRSPSPPVSLSFCLSLTVSCALPSIRAFVQPPLLFLSLPCLSLSLSCHSLFLILHLTSFIPSSALSLPPPALTHLISAASVQHICLVSGVKSA